jgi:hypothetical protein
VADHRAVMADAEPAEKPTPSRIPIGGRLTGITGHADPKASDQQSKYVGQHRHPTSAPNPCTVYVPCDRNADLAHIS